MRRASDRPSSSRSPATAVACTARPPMACDVLSTLYAAFARRRRVYAARRSARAPAGDQRRQPRGGRARQDADRRVPGARCSWTMGERPAILSRGLRPPDGRRRRGRRARSDGIRADLDRAGDEPLMLARQLPGRRRCSSASDRYLAGCLAERHLGATVHVLDDGFQHLQLRRDVDLVIVAGGGPRGRRPDAAGRPAARAAGHAARGRRRARRRRAACSRSAAQPRHAPFAVFACDRTWAPAQFGAPLRRQRTSRAVVRGRRHRPAAGVLRRDCAPPGSTLAGTLRLSRSSPLLARATSPGSSARPRAAGAARLLTTEKDVVRLLPFRPFPLPVGRSCRSYSRAIEPAGARSRRWLAIA